MVVKNDSKILRVLFVSHDSGMAGAQTTLFTLLEGIDRLRVSPYLILPDVGDLGRVAMNAKVSVASRQLVHWLPCVADVRPAERWHHIRRFFANFRTRVWAIAQIIEREAIDAVYTNTVTCVEGAVAARLTGRPHIWHIHEPISGNTELSPLLPEFMYIAAIKRLSAHVIFPSHSLATSYPALGSKATVINNGLSLPATRDRRESRAEVAAKLSIDTSRHWVAVVGAIQPRKDHDTFLKAAADVLRHRQDVHFIIVGTGAEYLVRTLQDKVQSGGLSANITMAGRWIGEISIVLAAMDVLVISSEQESFGLTAIESLAVETPVVATRCGGPEEIIDDGHDGLLVAVKDASSMAKAILTLVENPAVRRCFGEAGRRKVIERFSAERYCGDVVRVISSVVDTAESWKGNLTHGDAANEQEAI